MNPITPDFLTLPDRRLAYQLRRGRPDRPGIVFFGGYASDMMGTKAEFLASRCAEENISFLRFDYRGHGKSSDDFINGTFGDWYDDAVTVFDRLTEGPQIVIGSSMGGWIAMKLAVQKPERIQGLIGVAAGPDFTDDVMLGLSPEQMAELESNGVTYFVATPPAQPLPITKKFIEESRKHVLLYSAVNIRCPVRLLQGMQDAEVPWQHTMLIARAITHGNVRINLVKDGGHRLSRPEDMELLWRMAGEFLC